jgi:hypothetical protein
MPSAEPIKRTFIMSRILRMATVAVVLAFAATDAAHARAINRTQPYPGYAGPASASADVRSGEFAWSAPHHDGYDGNRYWWGGDCWPTEPGGCD